MHFSDRRGRTLFARRGWQSLWFARRLMRRKFRAQQAHRGRRFNADAHRLPFDPQNGDYHVLPHPNLFLGFPR
jgi:hypothetical protein